MAFTERYVTTTGAGAHDGTSESDAWDFDEMVTAVNAHSGSPLRVNVKSGTYSRSASTTLSVVPSQTNPITIRGYNSTIGDADDDTTFSGVDFSFASTYSLTLSYGLGLKNCTVTGDRNGAVLNIGYYAEGLTLDNCTISNANTGSSATTMGGSGNTNSQMNMATRCRFSATSTSANCVSDANISSYIDCVFVGGSVGLLLGWQRNCMAVNCVFRDHASHGLSWSNGGQGYSNSVLNCTFYDIGGSGIVLGGGGTNRSACIAGCVFDTIGAYAINISVHINLNVYNNSYYACTSGFTNITNHPDINSNSESSSPLTSSTNMTPVSGSLARAGRMPDVFRGESYRSYADIGAVQHQDSGGSSTRSPFGYIG